MGVLTRGLISIKPVRFKSDKTLEEIAERAVGDAYSSSANSAGSGWGGPYDEDDVLNEPVIGRFTVGKPVLVPEDDDFPTRLRLRYYYDQVNKTSIRQMGGDADWRRLHTRQAVDMVLLDDPIGTDANASRTALISQREAKALNATAVPALAELLECEPQDIETKDLAEELDPDFFSWLLYQLNRGLPVGVDVRLDGITEMRSRDRNLFGARFTEQADLDRIEMAALIVMGDHRFGPAKVDLSVNSPDANFDALLELDGGFIVMKSSRYRNRSVDPHLVGHALVDDMWNVVLPRMRDAFNGDSGWRTTGRDHLTDLATAAIRAILP